MFSRMENYYAILGSPSRTRQRQWQHFLDFSNKSFGFVWMKEWNRKRFSLVWIWCSTLDNMWHRVVLREKLLSNDHGHGFGEMLKNECVVCGRFCTLAVKNDVFFLLTDVGVSPDMQMSFDWIASLIKSVELKAIYLLLQTRLSHRKYLRMIIFQMSCLPFTVNSRRIA